MRVVIIDCFDSFTYNLYQLVGMLGATPVAITCNRPVSDVRSAEPDSIFSRQDLEPPKNQGYAGTLSGSLREMYQSSGYALVTRPFSTAMAQS